MVFYAVANGRTIGIFMTWNDCNNSVKGYKNAKYKKFDSKEEAVKFIHENNKTNININITDISNVKKQNTLTSFFEPKVNINDGKNNEKQEDINESFTPDYYVYTDGACSNNGKSSALAGIGIFFAMNDSRNVSKKVEGKQTNNTAELTAIIETYPIIESDLANGKKVAIVSDSEYAIKCVSSYGRKCYEKGWNVDIPNKELVKTAYEIYKDKINVNIQFIHIRAHTNLTDIHSIGNEQADKLANMAIGLDTCPYTATTTTKNSKIYFNVPFVKKDEMKKLGGLWDVSRKKWFIYDNSKNKDEIMSIFTVE